MPSCPVRCWFAQGVLGWGGRPDGIAARHSAQGGAGRAAGARRPQHGHDCHGAGASRRPGAPAILTLTPPISPRRAVQASKLGLGKNTCLVARYGSLQARLACLLFSPHPCPTVRLTNDTTRPPRAGQVVQFGLPPLVVHLIADASANTGACVRAYVRGLAGCPHRLAAGARRAGLMMDLGSELRTVLQPLQLSFAK